MNYPGNFGWTEERVELLKKLWADKRFSASMIGAEMGGISRNSVVGKVHRLHLPPRGPTSKPKTSSRGILQAIKRNAIAPAKPKEPAALFAGGFAGLRQGAKTPPSPPPPPEVKPGKGKSLLDFDDLPTNPIYCRWPINEPPRGGKYLFCGSPTLKDCPTWKDCPYCEAHAEQGLTEDGWKRTMAAKKGRAAA